MLASKLYYLQQFNNLWANFKIDMQNKFSNLWANFKVDMQNKNLAKV